MLNQKSQMPTEVSLGSHVTPRSVMSPAGLWGPASQWSLPRAPDCCRVRTLSWCCQSFGSFESRNLFCVCNLLVLTWIHFFFFFEMSVKGKPGASMSQQSATSALMAPFLLIPSTPRPSKAATTAHLSASLSFCLAPLHGGVSSRL